MRSLVLPLVLVVFGGCAGERLVGPLDRRGGALPPPVVRPTTPADLLAPAVAVQQRSAQAQPPRVAPDRAIRAPRRVAPGLVVPLVPRVASPAPAETTPSTVHPVMAPRVAGIRVREPDAADDCPT